MRHYLSLSVVNWCLRLFCGPIVTPLLAFLWVRLARLNQLLKRMGSSPSNQIPLRATSWSHPGHPGQLRRSYLARRPSTCEVVNERDEVDPSERAQVGPSHKMFPRRESSYPMKPQRPHHHAEPGLEQDSPYGADPVPDPPHPTFIGAGFEVCF